MSKFKKGDKVVSVKTGVKGVVDEVYDEEKYAVLFDGAANPDRVEGFQIRLANSRACNAKDGFGAEIKVGDRAKFITGTWRGLEGKVTKIEGTKATVKTDEQGEVVEDLKLIRVYNSAPVSANSVVRNAMAARTARNASDADVARYLAAAKDRIRAEVVALKDVAGLLKMEPVPPSAEKAYAKVVKAMASLQKAFAELS
jgi:preprotein translocase subunit YajC